MRSPGDESSFDGAPEASAEPNGSNRPPDDARAQELADELLVHAMLVGRHQDTPEAVSERVDRVCRAFRSSWRLVAWPWRAGLSTAAAAVILITIAMLLSPTQRVEAQFTQVLQAFDVGDKTYEIDISRAVNERVSGLRRGARHPSRRPAYKSLRGRAPIQRLDGALLFIRARQYVLKYTMPSGVEIARGFDGQQGWMVHPWRRYPPGNDPNVLRTEIPDEIVSLLFVDLRDMLHQIRRNYTLSEPSTSQQESASVLHLVADRVSSKWRLPPRIELWVDTETGQLCEILCSGVSFHRFFPRYTLRIALISTAPLPADWFSEPSHRSGSQAGGARRENGKREAGRVKKDAFRPERTASPTRSANGLPDDPNLPASAEVRGP